ncbi:MAG TPA: hypothetical protein VFV52_18460 [Bacilli bacterium]|nr:hypothetical protein [Bacilli bacterium]
MSKVLVLDTSMLCCWLQVPGKDTCVAPDGKWDFDRVNEKIQAEKEENTTFVIPLAAIIETGNHIAQAKTGNRYEVACKLAEIMRQTAESLSPWAAFDNQSHFWKGDGLKQLASEFPEKANEKISIGDLTIKSVADYYSKMGGIYKVEIFTADAGLKAYEPVSKTPPIPQPRRRKR